MKFEITYIRATKSVIEAHNLAEACERARQIAAKNKIIVQSVIPKK